MSKLVSLLLLIVIMISACRKDERITTDADAKLSFSADSILFDTIFTSIGSTTKRIKISNKNAGALNISEIKLSGGNASSFRLNINGQNTLGTTNLVLNGQDSINLFVKVTINPDAKSTAFLVQDSIILTSNGNKKTIQLLAYGQNAVFINNGNIDKSTSWTKNLPYIINGAVTVKNGATLTVEPGAKVYFHKDATMNIEGFLSANGSPNAPINFCSDRLEDVYEDEPGQWKGLYFKQNGGGVIRNAIIKNASVAVTSDSLSANANPKLILSNNVIKNMQVAAYIGYHSELIAFNNLVYNCGNYLIYAIGGGKYNLKQNTFAGINPNFPRKNAALTFSDYLSAKAYNKLEIELTNNIIWGDLENELNIQNKPGIAPQNKINRNLIKTTATNFTTENIINADPRFTSKTSANFRVSNGSAALKQGVDLSGDPYFNSYLNKDLTNTTRTFPSTLGCYENF